MIAYENIFMEPPGPDGAYGAFSQTIYQKQATPKKAESRTLVSLRVTSSGLSFFLWILRHTEIRGWQEGSSTKYIVNKILQTSSVVNC